MASSEDLLAQRAKLQHEILALESSLGNGGNFADLLSSGSDSEDGESDDSGHAAEDVAPKDLEAERQQIQREIEELERTLGADAALVDALTDSEHGSPMGSNGEDSDDDLDLPQDLDTCLQMNLVYQEVLNEKLADLERLLKENREQQKELEEQLSGPSYVNPGLPHLKLFLGRFMKPYFKDRLTGLGPPNNEETKERLNNGTKPCDELKIRRWEPWQKTLLINAVVKDTMKRKLQPKLSKMEYLTAKMSKAEEPEKEAIKKQITLIEKDIAEIRSMKEDQLYGIRHADHDWDKISNVDFEGLRQSDDLMRFWQNYLHPSINKSTWKQDEIEKLAGVAEKYKYCHWDQIAESLGTNRTAFMCFQTYQRYISKGFRKREWTKDEDERFKELVERMRIGNSIPYTQISYFMEGRDGSQLIYRWTCVLDPSLKKGPWTKEEDQLLIKAVKKYGCKDWWKIKVEVPGRTDSSCRDRYLDCLKTGIKKGTWSEEEVELLKKLVEKYGVGKWSKIAAEMPNRVDCQCLNKWKWMMQTAHKKGGVKRARTESRKREPQLKRRRVRQKKPRKQKEDDFHTESDTSEEEKEQVAYMDSDGEQPVENEDYRLEYVQPDMKDWIPVRENKQGHSARTVKTILVRMPTEAEKNGRGHVRNTVLDRLRNAVKTYVGMEPSTLQQNSGNESAMIMVSKCDVERLLISMKTSVMKVRTQKNKTRLSSCTNQNDATNAEEEHTSEMESCQRRRSKAVATTELSYDLMLAITPWIGNVIIPLPFNERQVCEADNIQKRAADFSLLKSPVFLFFLEALKVDAVGCKKVIEARKVSSTPGHQSRCYSARKPTPGSYRRIKTVADMLAEKTEPKEHSTPLQSSEFVKPAKIVIPPKPRQRKKTKEVAQSASQKINAALILPQGFVITQPNTDNKVGTSHNVVQGVIPFLQQGTQDASKNPQPVLHLTVPVKSGRVTQPASCPTTSLSTTGPSTETLEEVSTQKRKHKPTMKAQALLDNRKTKLSKKQAAKKQQNSSVTPTVAVLPQTTAWIVTPAGLIPIAGIQLQAPGIPAHENQVMQSNVQMIFQPPVVANQSSCVSLTNEMRPSSPTPDLTGNSDVSLTAGSDLDQNCRPSSVSDTQVVCSLPSSASNFPSVISAAVTNIHSVPQGLPETNLPISIPGSVAQVPPAKTVTCNQNKTVTPKNRVSSLVPGSSSTEETHQNLAQSCISDATNNVPSVSSVSAVTSTPSSPSVHPLNVSGPGTISGPPSQRMPIATANVAKVPPNSTTSSVNKSLSPSSTKSSLKLVNGAGPHVIKNTLPTVTANVTRVPPNAEAHIVPQVKKKSVQRAATRPNPSPKQITFDPSLMFSEQPAQVRNWKKGNGGITLPGLEVKLPYLPPFVSSINTLTTLLKGRESLLKSAVQLLPEEHRDNNEEDAKIAAVRKMVSERFKTNQAYLLLKARFMSCFTLPALLATINPCIESEEKNMNNIKQKQFEDGDQLK